jgi:predicted NUDIX family NTP pyrophosphohydrolase
LDAAAEVTSLKNPEDPASAQGSQSLVTSAATRFDEFTFMPKISAGLLMYRTRNSELEFLLVHPGGPFWKGKDAGAWTIPKGEIQPDEDPLVAAKREFEEELGFKPQGVFIELTPIKQKGGKIVRAWAFEGDCDPAQVRSNTFDLEWPPGSGRVRAFPEVDQAAFFNLKEAGQKINKAQVDFFAELLGQQKLAQ